MRGKIVFLSLYIYVKIADPLELLGNIVGPTNLAWNNTNGLE